MSKVTNKTQGQSFTTAFAPQLILK